jgi:hypothetical protein
MKMITRGVDIMQKEVRYLVELNLPWLKIQNYMFKNNFDIIPVSKYSSAYIYTLIEQVRSKYAEKGEYERVVISSEAMAQQLEDVIWELAQHSEGLCYWWFADIAPRTMQKYLTSEWINPELLRTIGYGMHKHEILIPINYKEKILRAISHARSHMREFRFVGVRHGSVTDQALHTLFAQQANYIKQLRLIFWETNMFFDESIIELTTFGEEECDHIMIKISEFLPKNLIKQIVEKVYGQPALVLTLSPEAYRLWDIEPTLRLFHMDFSEDGTSVKVSFSVAIRQKTYKVTVTTDLSAAKIMGNLRQAITSECGRQGAIFIFRRGLQRFNSDISIHIKLLSALGQTEEVWHAVASPWGQVIHLHQREIDTKQSEGDTLRGSLVDIGQETQNKLEAYLAGYHQRFELAEWAVKQLLQLPNTDFESSEYGHLLEYVLCRLTDDDWIGEEEFREEMQDLLERLKDALTGSIQLP